MQASIERYFEKKKLNKDVFRGRAAVALALAILIIISVFWWLKLTGITMAGEAFCGFTEHRHTEECIERTLICGFEEDEPVSETDSKPREDVPEVSVKEATEGVSDEASTDAVQQSESESEESVPTVSESEAPVGHIHTDECYKITYICGLTEHIHDVSCYSDSKADVESERDWKKTFESVTLTPDFADNLVAIAKTQLGYTESERNYSVDAEKVKHGYSRYGEWYGSVYGDWSAMFVEFCLYYTSGIGDNLPYSTGVETTRMEWEKVGVYQPIAAHTAVKGDILFWDTNGDDKADLTGIVSAADGEQYSVIVGDYNNSVCEITLAKNDATILGSTVQDKLLEKIAVDEMLWRIEFVTAEIDALPSLEEIAQTLSEYEAKEDMDGYAAYMDRIHHQSLGVYSVWEDLCSFRTLVKNADKLEMYSAFWASEIATDTPTVYQINYYWSEDRTLLVSGSGTIKDIVGSRNAFTYWNMYVVSKDASGYYVSQIVTDDVSKAGYSPGDGFIFLTYGTNYAWNISVGDRVEVNCPLTGVHKQSDNNGAGYGTIGKTINKNNLTPIQSVDTSEFIEINLFNYGNKINTYYNNYGNYLPGFQQEYGTPSIGTTLGTSSFNFGNNITADLAAGINNLVSDAPTDSINDLYPQSPANLPLNGVMKFDLSSNGYPQLAKNVTHSELSWLFSNNAETSTTQLNTQNITGLFLQDPETGAYYFDSRLHNAQYNAATQKFELYNQLLTPNYLMYPFGNFLPFNNINTQSTLVENINRQYFVNQANIAATKHANGQSVTTPHGSSYSYTSTALNTFVTRMTAKYGSNFTWKNAVDAYFATTGIPEGGGPGDVNGDPNYNPFSNLYNLDYSEPTDFYFGMSMHLNFIMPKDGLTGPNGDQPLVFDFNGDDDVWVYLDGKLYLDLSGIHRHVGGRIDFENGRVMYYEFDKATGRADISVDTGIIDPATGESYRYINERGETVYYVPFSYLDKRLSDDTLNENGTYKDYTEHTIDFFYMERGSGSSVCNISFNFPLLQKNSISVTKQMDSTDDLSVIGNPDFNFQILKPNGSTPFIGEGVEYIINDANTQQQIGTGVTGPNGVFSIKAGQTAVFPGISEDSGQYFVRELLDTAVFEQYGTVTVDGKTTTLDHYTNVTVNNDTFRGVDSAVKNISDGTTAFAFTNHIDIYKYGALEIHKEFWEYESGLAAKNVTFEILLGGKPVPAGTPYLAILPDGSEETRTVTKEGFITFRSDETVRFPGILAGTNVLVREVSASTEGYRVTYQAVSGFTINNFEDSDGEYGLGMIESGKVAVLKVVNEKEGTKLILPFEKHLLYPDGRSHTYIFRIDQIDGIETRNPTGYYNKTTVEITEGVKDFNFTLNFPPGTPDGVYYYRIYEEDASASNGMDTTWYMVAVTVSTANGKTDAVITGRYAIDGSEVAEGTPLSFTNRNIRPLTVKKTVQGVASSDAFTFTISASVNGTPLSGIYYVQGPNGITLAEFIDGEATFSLRNGESITFVNLPYGTEWTVTEAPAGGYFTRYSVNAAAYINGSEAQGTLNEQSTVAFVNVGGYELPSTGSSAHLWFIIVGMALMLSSLIIGYYVRRRQERRLS